MSLVLVIAFGQKLLQVSKATTCISSDLFMDNSKSWKDLLKASLSQVSKNN